MSERAPYYDPSQIPASGPDAEVFELPKRIDPEEFPAATGFYEFCEANPQYGEVSEAVQTRLRPKLALDYVRTVVTRTGVNKNREDIKPYFDEMALKRYIERFQSDHGIEPHEDKAKDDRRSEYMEKRRSLANSFSRFPEIAVAQKLYTELIEVGDMTAADSTSIVLTAYGSAINERVGGITD